MQPHSWPSVEALYLRSPSPEYQQAFDLAAARLNDAPGQALVVLSSPAHATEFLKRCAGPLDFASAGRFDAQGFIAAAGGWAWGPVRAVSLDGAAGTYSAITWAEPERDSAAAIAASMRSRACAGASLDVLATSALRRFLPAWQRQPLPASQPLSVGETARCLRRAGWQVEQMIAFHGPRSLAWSRLAQAAAVLRRPDWEDRIQFAMRACYREKGWLWPLAPLALIRARRV